MMIDTSIGRTIIYTCGHIIIAKNVVYWLTGASIFETGLVALDEPTINAMWFYALDKYITERSN